MEVEIVIHRSEAKVNLSVRFFSYVSPGLAAERECRGRSEVKSLKFKVEASRRSASSSFAKQIRYSL